jgi:hypothetical protein
MATQTEADGGTQRITDNLSLTEVEVGDRIDPAIVPRSTNIDAGERIQNVTPAGEPDEDRTYAVRLVAETDRTNNDVLDALVYEPATGLFARLSAHTQQAAWNQKEADWKVRDVGSAFGLVDCWDVDVHDLPEDETETEYVGEWLEILGDGWAHGEYLSEIEHFCGDTMTLRDHDNRTAKLQYRLVQEDD